jgi:hypothetical protein
MQIVCDNHDDGKTGAVVQCEDCRVFLCAECDKVLHLPKRMRGHVRQVETEPLSLSIGTRLSTELFFNFLSKKKTSGVLRRKGRGQS